MSMDFVAALSSNDQSLIDALVSVDLALINMGAQKEGVIRRDDPEDLAGHDVEDELVTVSGSISSIHKLIADWRGAAIEYRFPQFTIYLEFVIWQAGFLNAFHYVDTRQMKRLREEGRLGEYYLALGNLGTALHARGGIADIELDVEPMPPGLILELFFSRLPPLGLIAKAETSLDDLQRRTSTGPSYRIEVISDFYMLIADPS